MNVDPIQSPRLPRIEFPKRLCGKMPHIQPINYSLPPFYVYQIQEAILEYEQLGARNFLIQKCKFDMYSVRPIDPSIQEIFEKKLVYREKND